MLSQCVKTDTGSFPELSGLDKIKAVNWDNFSFIDLFAGIGGIRLGFESVGGRSVFSSEIDADAIKMYEANFGDRPYGDITKILPQEIPDHDILLGGFPCQPFSIIGNRKGFADIRGTLFFNIAEILREKRPPAILLENVKQFKTHDNGRTCRAVLEVLESLGYHTHITILNALNYGVPQKRERTFIVGFLADIEFEFPKPCQTTPNLAKILESDEDVDPKLFVSAKIKEKRLARLKMQGREPFYPSVWHENKGGHIGMHPFSCALRANASYNYLLVNGYRRLSSRECLRFQGFPDSFQMVVNHTAVRKLAGNSVAVPVIKAIAGQMIASLKEAKIQKREAYLFSDMQKQCVCLHGIK
jgi:DNA (cytosine-5)-methyltransferase 1